MPEFAYTARTLSGENVAGTMTAASKRDTLSALAVTTDRAMVVARSKRPRSRIMCLLLVGYGPGGTLVSTPNTLVVSLIRDHGRPKWGTSFPMADRGFMCVHG